MATLIFETPKSKVYECPDGTYTVHLLRTHYFDGMPDRSWDVEHFEEDGIYSIGGVCTHNFPRRYPNNRKSLKEMALKYAKSFK